MSAKARVGNGHSMSGGEEKKGREQIVWDLVAHGDNSVLSRVSWNHRRALGRRGTDVRPDVPGSVGVRVGQGAGGQQRLHDSPNGRQWWTGLWRGRGREAEGGIWEYFGGEAVWAADKLDVSVRGVEDDLQGQGQRSWDDGSMYCRAHLGEGQVLVSPFVLPTGPWPEAGDQGVRVK